MRNIFLLFVLFTGITKAQIVNIPDANFKARLLAADPANTIAYGNNNYIKIDANGDGEIQDVEAQTVDSLNVDFSGIADMSGISGFVNLKKLICDQNSITTLDLSGNTLLTELSCFHNELTSLSLAGLNNLQTLSCGMNQLTALDFSGHSTLTTVDCSENSITTINLAGCSNLVTLNCNLNAITAINLTGLTGLKHLICNNNALSAIDLAPVPQLETLHCSENPIMAIDVSFLTSLHDFGCMGTLISILDVSNLTGLTGNFAFGSTSLLQVFMKNGVGDQYGMDRCENLQYICADPFETEFLIAGIPFTNSNPNAVINSYCSFVPGGSYNHISGTIAFDPGNNGCDATDVGQPFMRIDTVGPTESGSVFTDMNGIYHAYIQEAGSCTLTPNFENADWFTISPADASITFPDINNNEATQNFCIVANGIHAAAEIVINPTTLARPGFDANYKLIYKNKGNQTISGSINVTFDDARTDFVQAVPATDNQSLNTLLWNFTNLKPFETRTVDFTLNLNSPLETPAVNDGDILDFMASIRFALDHETLTDSIFEFHQRVVNSLDPNDKTCLEGDAVTPDKIGKYLHYNINFENTGSASAVNIVVKDTINTTKFDLRSLQLLYGSHPLKTKITGNVVEFIFENINLPIGGHGNVLFKIKTSSDLVIDDEVMNIASIFFDYNAPIETNEARTVFRILENSGFEKDNSVSISPNPAKDHIAVRAKSKIKTLQLFDVLGRILQTSIENKNTAVLDISNRQSGIYFLKIITEKGSFVEKLVKE